MKITKKIVSILLALVLIGSVFGHGVRGDIIRV